MLMHAERKHWYSQFPLSWGVEIVLVIALLAGTAFAASQVTSRNATIADLTAEGVRAESFWTARVQERDVMLQTQATTLSQQATALQQTEAQRLMRLKIAEIDDAIIQTYGVLQTQRTAMDNAQRGFFGEVYESYEVAALGAKQAEARIEQLLDQRLLLLYDR